MSKSIKKVTINLPEEMLERARKITGKGITETIVEGLQEIERRQNLSALRRLKGKVAFDLDLKQTRK